MIENKNKFSIGGELFELNWRFWGFVLVLLLSAAALYLYPVGEYKGYVDPFYSPTVIVLPFVALFRLSCYAYRKDYYRHVFKHPMACLNDDRMDSSKRVYRGETGFFSLNNFHRYFFYIGLALLPFFYYDFYVSMFYTSGFFIFRLGSIIILANALLLTFWTVSCHAFRHLIGGYADCYSCLSGGNTRKKIYNGQSWLNLYHEQFAFISLLVVVAVDLYIRALMAGWPVDFTFLRIAI